MDEPDVNVRNDTPQSEQRQAIDQGPMGSASDGNRFVRDAGRDDRGIVRARITPI